MQLAYNRQILCKFTPEDKVKYEFEMTTERDIRNQIKFAERRGDLKRSLETARKMLSKGYPVEEIVEISELPIEQVLALQEEA